MKLVKFVATLLIALVVAPQAIAKTHVVEMRNSVNGQAMVFSPAYVEASAGDTVVFKLVDKGHDAVTIPGILPAGATPIAGKMNQDVTVVLRKPGLYGVKCTPHFGMGMIALIKVGRNPANEAAAATAALKLPGLAKRRMAELLAKAK